jgi:hypothetical protein
MVTADEVRRSLRGTIDLLNQRAEGLRAFDLSETGFWHSFAAISLTLPAYVVSLALEQRRIAPDAGLPDIDATLALVVALGHVASFLALPVAMIWIARRLRLGARYVPFVTVTNWIAVIAFTVLSAPAVLLLLGWATPALASLFTLAFAIVILRLHWFATKVTLGVSGRLALAIVLLGIGLNVAIGGAMHGLIG